MSSRRISRVAATSRLRSGTTVPRSAVSVMFSAMERSGIRPSRWRSSGTNPMPAARLAPNASGRHVHTGHSYAPSLRSAQPHDGLAKGYRREHPPRRGRRFAAPDGEGHAVELLDLEQGFAQFAPAGLARYRCDVPGHRLDPVRRGEVGDRCGDDVPGVAHTVTVWQVS